MSSWLTKKEKEEEQPEGAKEEAAEPVAAAETDVIEKAPGEESAEGAEAAGSGNLIVLLTCERSA